MNNRLKRLRSYMSDQKLSGIVVTKPENRRYFSGFTGTSGILFITQENSFLLTDFRYIDQAKSQAPDYEVIKHGISPYELLKELTKNLSVLNIGFESDYMTVDIYRHLARVIDPNNLVPTILDSLRMVKEKQEIELVKKAVDIADEAFYRILTFIKPGLSEQDVALELEYKMRRLGAEKSAFDIIVASGNRGALPHGVASTKKLEQGELVTMDFGAVYQGYHSDITRTICIGKSSERQREIYNIVLEAQLAGVQAVKSGCTGREIDSRARTIIENAGYGEYFGHGLGHGVGLAIHEEPRLSPANADGVLSDSMTVTVEPGIYIPGWGGIRIEDTVVVAANKAEVLTASSKQLIELDF